ncbi:hypothetical protein PDIG_26950 [Penicillium digitatum PHI26]|uniref:Helicase-like protein n=2 Tax=Penicillium digitatum TaxID=36651 RepID=K9G3F1_PEND2|nr:hypothetical protein PDIP_61400 [Penicillium digitatum Pd1]EKV10220.1 hypothetical protein PDIP_61400 [Penicillium digitatum Pd1]EKV15392.1 hypothetical protein PDIG_26950 [Penicillium digitatum PHI26]
MAKKDKEQTCLSEANSLPKLRRVSSGQRDDSKDPPGSPRHGSPAAEAHCEPTQPGNIYDLLESRLEMASKSKHNLPGANPCPPEASKLTTKDIKALLSGAPHFLLEKGKHGRWYPEVIFPWDEQNPVIQHMWDRKPLPHATFTLSTLHAHLPLPDDWAVRGGVPTQVLDWRRTDATNRATFDIGIFEVPNMLSQNGKEPGTVGFRHFLELPVADTIRYTGPEAPRKPPCLEQVSTMAAMEAFDLMEGYNKPYSQCQSGAVHDRCRLICEGPEAWKRIGVRDINMRSLVQRLEHLRNYRYEMLKEGSRKTILDIESPRELHDILHTQFLHPHPPPADIIEGHPQSVKSQIKTLAIVLATPGAWINFSLPEWRFRAGQVLWETSQHGDGACLDPTSSNEKLSQNDLVRSGMERKWLLIQMLLSAELLLRLDAFVRVGMLHDPQGGHITMHELAQFEKLREGKLNWDLIVVRRFLNSLHFTCPTPHSGLSPSGSTTKPPGKSHRFSLLESIIRRSSLHVADLQSAWDCELSSSHVRQQLEGLYVFAENIGWPKLAALRATMELKLGDPNNPVLPVLVVDDRWGQEKISKEVLLTKDDLCARNPCRRRVKLCNSGPQSKRLGWISRSLLSGFVIPGDAISHLLMATLLENDVDALDQLGSIANLYGGFVYSERSWWSKACIVGRVLSSSKGAQTCMGWISSDMIPRDESTRKLFKCGWLELQVEEVPQISSRPRIKQGAKLAIESTPLGLGDITAKAFTLPTENPESSATHTVTIEDLTLSVSDYNPPNNNGITPAVASMSFSIKDADSAGVSTTVSFPLTYDVRFISAHECCPPLGVVSHKPSDREKDEIQPTRPVPTYTRLPGHPLHNSYRYKNVSLDSLPSTPAPQSNLLQGPDAAQVSEIIVIDARGNRDKETFARAWCAAVGCHAIISRFGETRVTNCVACSIRQARAIDVMVVIRVSE